MVDEWTCPSCGYALAENPADRSIPDTQCQWCNWSEDGFTCPMCGGVTNSEGALCWYCDDEPPELADDWDDGQPGDGDCLCHDAGVCPDEMDYGFDEPWEYNW